LNWKEMKTTENQTSLTAVSEDDFSPAVLQSAEPVLVAFLAAWSKPCQIVQEVLLEVGKMCAGKVRVVTVDADDNPHLSLWYEIQSLPTLLYIKAGKVREKVVGTVSKEAILNLLDPSNSKASARTSSCGADL
jgi:thioredoxin 1